MSSLIHQLHQLPQTVFTTSELAQLFPQRELNSLYNSLAYYVRQGHLQRLRRGIYAKLEYRTWELANKLYAPSYVSLNTILLKEGVIFQADSMVYSVSYLTRQVKVDSRFFSYHKLKPSILSNLSGVKTKAQVSFAIPERAFLDKMYLVGDFHVDNLQALDWDLVLQLVPLYQQQVLLDRVRVKYKLFRRENA
jgi:hypothetical protein